MSKKNDMSVQNDENSLPDIGSESGSGDIRDGSVQETGERDGDGENEETREDAGEGEREEIEEERKILTAVYPVLYLSHQYRVGDELPANNPDMVSAWIDAGTAVWMSAEKESPRAKPRTAQPGVPGLAAQSESQDEDGDNLIGKVPVTNARKR